MKENKFKKLIEQLKEYIKKNNKDYEIDIKDITNKPITITEYDSKFWEDLFLEYYDLNEICKIYEDDEGKLVPIFYKDIFEAMKKGLALSLSSDDKIKK